MTTYQKQNRLSKRRDKLSETREGPDVDACAKHALLKSHENCLEFPWIKERVNNGSLKIHLWFFDIKDATIYAHDFDDGQYKAL